MSGALPVVQLLVNGRRCQVLVDTGSTETIVHASCCMRWQPRITSVTTISGDTFRCTGVGEVSVETPAGLCARLEALVVSQPPLARMLYLASQASRHLVESR